VNRVILAIATTISAATLLTATDASAQATFSRVSVATDGGPADAESEGASISADGRYVAFSSAASNLVANDTNGSRDIFVRDRVANVTTRVSVTSAGEQRVGDSTAPDIGASGRFIVFLSTAPLVADDTQTCQPAPALPACQDVYVHDRETGTTTRTSVSTAGAQADGDSYEPHISSDGRFVVFESLATTLATGGTPGVRHAYLRNRQNNTTIRLVGVGMLPQQPAGEPEPRISDDGSTVTFSGFVDPTALASTPDDLVPACWHANACPATYYYRTSDGWHMVLSPFFSNVKSDELLFADEPVYMSADGGHIILKQVMLAKSGTPPASDARFLSFKVPMSGTITGPWRSSGELADIIGSSGDGRYHVWMGTSESSGPHTRVFHDHVADLDDTVTFAASTDSSLDPPEMSLSHDARFAAFVTRSPLDAADTNGLTKDIYVMDRDADGDGMPSGWETRFGLLPADGTDAAGDPDGDGVDNLAEYQRGSHPDKGFTRYLAEGAANGFFTTRLALVNPQNAPVDVALRLLGSNHNRMTELRTLPARSRSTIALEGFLEARGSDFATVVESDQPIVVDRTMIWDSRRHGAHAETSIEAPATTWYLAEGATHGNFDLFYLLLNATAVEATAAVTYLRPAPLPPIVKTYTVPPNGRKTIYVDVEGPQLEETDVSAVITSDQPIVVERAMYSSLGGVPFAAGHGGAGVTAPALTWFLAEGATGTFFDLYLLIANPGSADSRVSITYLLPDGGTITHDHDVEAQSRKTITVDDQAAQLANTPVSMIVRSANNQPIIVERAMWWPSPNWYEAHLAAGTTTTGTRWALADGEIGSAAGEVQDTYILIANTGEQDGTATVTLLVEGGDPVVTQVPLKARSRTNVPTSGLFPAGTNAKFGAIIESNGVPIVVERAMYTSVGAMTWTAGTAAVATKLQ
jgi:hypothetical protein